MASNWWVNSQPGPTAPGGTTTGGGGYGTDAVTYRNPLDARRSMAGQESAYPDGYLGTITDRQQDKLLAKVQERLTDRSYQRGVHVGSTVGRDQYFWPASFNPEIGLERQAQAVQDGYTIDVPRFAPTGDPAERLAHMGKTGGMITPDLAARYGVAANIDRGRLATMLPPWA